ncbi:DNA-directed RNA polymerase [Azorhizobium caulinodans ORS 571]|uniref:DNA-directed RNA polymerase n=1 Tax=Azorhizobium caulinodans (strain ATCC 43989 / DSM 5975 / JCM 20966 / LMG 6465 / NBRC 14845 / NCIMB 13405 / ORS 571) TaxID=438753 RepID=A8IFE5_AZOC5|nr:DNA-directed RNA polymerase [Azorhizobium caulinodans]BAF89605.1 DNA-directed RNA polymerase [Azorhizobium caulinodans ORS 571]
METLSTTALDRQIALEEQMLMVGRETFYRDIEKAKERGEEAGTPYGMRLLKNLVLPVSDALEAFIEKARSGGAGRRHTALKYVEMVEPEVAAYLALKTVLDSITRRETLQRCAIRVASALQDEVRMRAFRERHPERFKVTMSKIERATSRRYKTTVARLMAGRVGIDEDWPTSDKLHVGIKLIEVLREATGMVDIQRDTMGINDTQVFVVATEATLQWIADANQRMEFLSPAFLPTIIPPKRWTTPFDGGYHSGLVQRLPFVKTRNRNYLEELAGRDLSAVYAAVNAMQETPWQVNRDVLRVLKEAWDRDLKSPKLKLPPRDPLDLPPKPADIATNEVSRKEWKKAASLIHAANAKLKSKRVQIRKIIELAGQFSEYAEIYFPYQLDFRGRVYAVPMFLNPQGPDHAKALLTFARGKPIGDGVAAGWLAIHGANVYGYDKASLEDRISWVEERNALIASVAADPWGEGFEFWTEADKPWQFLAFCFEWAGFLREGFDYVSTLPVALDGSCNGLQHYSAALRDPVGGAAVNLVPSGKPQDIYARVAEVALGLVTAFVCPNGSTTGTIPNLSRLRKTWAEHGIDELDMANRWLAFGIDRKVTKRAVMTLPYGSTQYSCREFIEEAVREKVEEGKPNPFAVGDSDGIFKATLWLQPLVWQAIGEVVKAARVGMDWLKECARLAAAEGLPVIWQTPDGFLVQQSYRNSSARRIDTHLDGRVRLIIREELDTIDKRRQQQGVAPNWVHSMDATAMRMFINLALTNGMQHFALVHDSYGTVAADVELMGACLRKAFVQLYTDCDPLAEFRVDIAGMLSDDALGDLPEVPAKGTLDVSLVEESDFFFA